MLSKIKHLFKTKPYKVKLTGTMTKFTRDFSIRKIDDRNLEFIIPIVSYIHVLVIPNNLCNLTNFMLASKGKIWNVKKIRDLLL